MLRRRTSHWNLGNCRRQGSQAMVSILITKKLFDRKLALARIADVCMGIGKCEFHGLDQMVIIINRSVSHSLKIQLAGDIECQQGGQSLPIGRNLMKRITIPIIDTYRVNPFRLIAGKVVHRKNTPSFLNARGNLFCNFTLVEAIVTLFSNRLQRCRKFQITKHLGRTRSTTAR